MIKEKQKEFKEDIEESIEIEDSLFFEEKDIKIFRKYQILASNCPVQRKINYGNYNHLFKRIEENHKNRINPDFDILFFLFFFRIYKESTVNDDINFNHFEKIKNINSLNFNILFFNKDGFIEIDDNSDFQLCKRLDLELKHHIYDFKNKYLKAFNDIHFISIYKIIQHVYREYFNQIIHQRFFNKNTIIYYLSITDLIIKNPKMCEEIIDDYNLDYCIVNPFKFILINPDKKACFSD